MADCLFQLSVLFSAVTINKGCRTSKTGEVSLSNMPPHRHYPLALNTSPHSSGLSYVCMLIVKGDTADSASQAHSHTHTRTHTSQKVASYKKRKEIEFIHEITMQHAISDCTRSPTGRSTHQTNTDCLPSPLFPRALPPSFLFSLSNCSLSFHYVRLCFSAVCDAFCAIRGTRLS